MNKKLILLGVLVVTLVLFLGAVSAVTPEKRVTTVNSVQYGQSSDGTKVVWVDKRSGVENIYVRDLTSPAPELAIDAKTTKQTNPDISGNIIVWEDYRKGTAQIYYKNIKSTGIAYAVKPNAHLQEYPRISGNKVVWNEFISGKWSLQGYDLKNDKKLNLPSSENHQYLQDIDGNNVIYIENENELLLFDLISQNITTIDSTPVSFDRIISARIDGDNIIYNKFVGHSVEGKKVIKIYNIVSKKTITISKSTNNAGNPDIYGIIAVWNEASLFMKNISKSTNPIIKINENKYTQVRPSISGNSKIGYFVTWWDYRNDGTKPVLYYRNMETIPPIILSTVPQNNQWGVNLFSRITIKFNKFIKPGANYSKIRVRNLATNKNIAITKFMKYDTLVIKTAAKKPRTFYQVILPAKSVISVANNNLSTTKTIKFRTRA